MKFWFLITSALIFVSCSTSNPRRSAKTQVVSLPAPVMKPHQAVPKTSSENLLKLGQKAYQAHDYPKSFDFFVSAIQGLKGTPKEIEAQYWAMRASAQLGRWSETLALTDDLLKFQNWAPAQLSEIVASRIRALEAVGDHNQLLQTLQSEMEDPKLKSENDSFRLKALEVIESGLSAGDLEAYLETTSPDFLKAAASFRLGEISLDAKDMSNAQVYFHKAQNLGHDNETSRRAADILSQLDNLSKVESKTVGVVLPLTGKHSVIAQKTLRGIEMGLGLYGKNISSFKVAVVDDEANPDKARQGVERLVREDNVIGVIGSLESKTASGVASKSSELGVPSLALSQKAGITELGPTVHRNSLTSEMQVRWLVKQAMEELGMKKFALLYPNDPYGVEFANIFWDEVLARGGQITSAQTYSSKETDFRFVIQRLVGTYYVDSRADEYRLRLKDWKEKNKNSKQEPPEDLLPPIVDFDAIFIPDSVKALGQIAAMLSFNDVKGIKLLGTNLWNVPGVQKRAGSWSKDLIFVDSFVATDPTYQASSFVRDYKALFGEEPGIFELQGYDSALIFRQLISQGNSSRDSLTRALGQLHDVPGALAKLSMGPDREVQRPLVALTLENGQIVPLVSKNTP